MKRKLFILFALCFSLFTVVVGAASINGEFNEFPIVKVTINGKSVESEVPAVNFFGKTVLPVRDVAETLNTIVEWDGETWTANLVKPQINMVFADNVKESEEIQGVILENPFGLIAVGENNNFYTYTTVNGLDVGEYEFRYIVLNPENEIIHSTQEFIFKIEENAGGFYSVENFENVAFNKVGTYKFQMQMNHNGTFKTIYENDLVVY